MLFRVLWVDTCGLEVAVVISALYTLGLIYLSDPMHQQITTQEIDMEKYLEYKQWWLQYGIGHYRYTPASTDEELFEGYINSMTTYELMETLANWGD
jgi:hypothetical protein